LARNLTGDRVDRAMLESINHLVHVMGIRTIAQWMENQETVQVLRGIGMHFAQERHRARTRLAAVRLRRVWRRPIDRLIFQVGDRLAKRACRSLAWF
jgi:nitrate reductase alpha subunit